MDWISRQFCYAVFHLVLKPLILMNCAKRKRGLLPDEWYWADELACDWGYFVEAS